MGGRPSHGSSRQAFDQGEGAAVKKMAGLTGHCGIGGAEGDRTLDLRIANATLSQLSYRPITNMPKPSAMAGYGEKRRVL